MSGLPLLLLPHFLLELEDVGFDRMVVQVSFACNMIEIVNILVIRVCVPGIPLISQIGSVAVVWKYFKAVKLLFYRLNQLIGLSVLVSPLLSRPSLDGGLFRVYLQVNIRTKLLV